MIRKAGKELLDEIQEIKRCGGQHYEVDADRMIVKTGQALLEADARGKAILVDQTISPIEGAFRWERIQSLASKLAASALEDIVDLGPDQVARLRAISQMCWHIADKISDEEMGLSRSAQWQDLGQALYDASYTLQKLIEDNKDAS